MWEATDALLVNKINSNQVPDVKTCLKMYESHRIPSAFCALLFACFSHKPSATARKAPSRYEFCSAPALDCLGAKRFLKSKICAERRLSKKIQCSVFRGLLTAATKCLIHAQTRRSMAEHRSFLQSLSRMEMNELQKAVYRKGTLH